ncbi:Peptidase C48, SUMO/Sentrin/Ubl1 [Artemisia annua]|uniref:Peptidase C48, SUMO/Sentrin/Ubl1 n=1 Tax=Artemisia annua TaxID=35608 RepID=A0A2U1KXN5_ARTAN|nr:Peptidase C48, SUMO/Sentrin/Ubl1 [Artemisia annua]
MTESDDDNTVMKPYLSPAKKKDTKTPKNPISELADTLKEGMQKFKEDKTLFSLCKKYKKIFNVLDFVLNEGEKKDEQNESDDGDTDDDDSDDGSDDNGGADDECDNGKDNDGSATIRDNMQILAPQLKVDVSIIDSFACILNYEETINKPAAPKINQFFHTGILAFFPIIAHEHFYLVVFNISKGTSVIIDNSPKAYDAKYKKECDVLGLMQKKLLSRYLESHNHEKAAEIASKKTTVMKVKLATKENVIDCGIFLMMHVEQYDGETAKNWNLELPKEGREQEIEIIKIRIKLQNVLQVQNDGKEMEDSEVGLTKDRRG